MLEVSLRKAGYSITVAESKAQALQFLELADPELIISDTRLPDGDGFEFCRLVKSHSRWGGIPFIFLTHASTLDEKIRGLELGVDDYLTKPIYVKEVTIRVKMLLQRKQQERIGKKDTRTKFSGQLADMAIVDLLQTIEISRKSGTIEFETELGAATVWFRDGRVIDAQMGRLQASAVIYRLLGLSEGRFEVEFKPISRAATIEETTQALLMEGMRRLDEWGRLLEGLPPLDHVLTVDPAASADATPTQVELLRRFNGKRSIVEVIDDSGLDDLEALSQISGLYFEGALTGLHESHPPEGQSSEAPESLDGWNLALSTSRRFKIPRTLVSVSPREAEADLPPVPSFPQPFPGAGGGDQDDALVGGIPEDSQNGVIGVNEVEAARQAARPGQVVASPMGAARAAAVGELSTDGPEVTRAPPSSSVIVRARPVEEPDPSASESSLEIVVGRSGPHALLAESHEDMSRLNALVAQALSGQPHPPSSAEPSSLERTPPAPAPTEEPSEPAEEPPPSASGKWIWIGGLVLAAGLLLFWSREPPSSPPDEPVSEASKKRPELHTKEERPSEPKEERPSEPKEERPSEPKEGHPSEPKEERPSEPKEERPPEDAAPSEAPQELTAAQRKRLERADQAYHSGRGKEATALLEGLLAEAPRSAEVFTRMANVQIDAGRAAEALTSARRAVELDPGLADAYLVLGVILQGQKDVSGAIEAYRKYLELAPKARYATTVRAQLRSLEREASP